MELAGGEGSAGAGDAAAAEAEKAARKEAKKREKEAKKREKEAKKAANAAQRGKKQAVELDASDLLLQAGKYGPAPLIQSTEQSGKTWTPVGELAEPVFGQEVLCRGRVHTVRSKGKSCFLVVREAGSTVQVTVFEEEGKVSRGMLKWVGSLTRESIVDIEGTVKATKEPVTGCTQETVEISASAVRLISKAELLPFEMSDAERREGDESGATVLQDMRLDNRFLDLRTPANQAIFRIQSAVCRLFRESLSSKNFTEIHTPKIIPGASEGGSSVFKLDYMGRPACLAQSPQLYKQMAICSDFGRVFEIGPVFRAENSNTHRHLCEFVGLDMEMEIKEHYQEALDVLGDLFVYMFDGLKNGSAAHLEAVNAQYPFRPLRYLRKTLQLTFPEGIQMLRDAGYDADPLGDLSTETERVLGQLVAEKYETDFYILTRYPAEARPFYTMLEKEDPRYTNSYDIFIRGEEIISGAQRIHDPQLLTERAIAKDIPVETIQDYINGFKFGAVPHAGAGVGMERVVMLYLGLNNIRKSSMFPRDPSRLNP